ncbi:MAG: hypothetical protein ACRDZZ_11930, partial [Ilumatobacteraceae bacterium]
NEGWEATVDEAGHSIDRGPGELVDGGFNGWYLPPSDSARTVSFEWTPQRTVTIALWLSVLAVIGCIALVIVDRRRRPIVAARPPLLVDLRRDRVPGERATVGHRLWVAPVVTTVVAVALAGPGWGMAGLVVALGAVAARRPRLLAAAALAVWLGCGAIVLWRVVRYRPFPDAGWPGNFEDLHRPGMLVLALLAGSLAAADVRVSRPTTGTGGSLSSS